MLQLTGILQQPDLINGLILMALATSGVFLLTILFTRKLKRRTCDLLAIGVLVLIPVYVFFVRDHIVLFQLLPYSNLVVLGNWLPLAAGVMAGLVWSRLEGGLARKAVPLFGLTCIALFAMVQPLMGTPPISHSLYKDGIAIQSSNVTCSAAAAVTLLELHGISTTEREMVNLCLTRNGTTSHGLYRGLKLKTADTEYDVEVFECSTEELKEIVRTGPCILSVELKKNARADSIYSREWGWVPGQPHTVILFRFLDHDRVLIGDPSFGIEPWTGQDLELLWQHRGFRLVKRN